MASLQPAVQGFLTSRRYHATKTRPASARHLRNELLIAVIKRLHEENYGVYGMRKVHALLKQKGWDIGGDQTARLMNLARGARCGTVKESAHHQKHA